jgi:hypothetical protein
VQAQAASSIIKENRGRAYALRMERRRIFSILAEEGGLIEHFPGESEQALLRRIGSREVIGHYTTTICNDCDEASCTQGPGRPALEMRNVFTIERMCDPATSGMWHLDGGARSSNYSLTFRTKEELVDFLEGMPRSWRADIPEERWGLAVASARQILNVPRLRLVE